jgi:putative peptide zinc metalloprotease protein
MTAVQPPDATTEGTQAQAAENGDLPLLARGVELLGRYEDSGYEEPPYIARRPDGQIVQLAPLLHQVAERADGKHTNTEIAESVTAVAGVALDGDDVRYLIDEKLRPLGVVAAPGEQPRNMERADPLLALRFRVTLIPERAVRAVTSLFLPFFYPVVIAAALAGLGAADVWVFGIHGIAQGARQIAYNPILLLAVLGLVALATLFHEIGHATAARYGGAHPGVMGAGIYVVWPAFYTDVTDAYRLGRWGRVRTDLGGVYFNVLFILATVGVYLATGWEPLLLLVLVQHIQILQQLVPFLRLDGYYVLSDLTGVPDLFSRIKPTLASSLPWKHKDDRAQQLKPWVRRTVVTWIVLLIPVLLIVFGLMLLNAPRIVATAWDSFLVNFDRTSDAAGNGHPYAAFVGGVQMAVLAVPAIGFALGYSRASTHVLRRAWMWADGEPQRRLAIVATCGAVVAVLALLWWPNGEYRPIQPGERGTIQGGIAQLDAIPSGRPALTRERQQELGGAPTVRTLSHSGGGPGDPADQTDQEPTGSPTTDGGLTIPGQETTTPGATAPASTVPTSMPEATVTTETAPTETTPTISTPTETAPAETTPGTTPAATTALDTTTAVTDTTGISTMDTTTTTTPAETTTTTTTTPAATAGATR